MRKQINYTVLIFLYFIFTSCSNYKYIYGYANEDSYKSVSKSMEYVINKNELFLVFTKNYDDIKVKVVQNDIVLLDNKLSTDKSGKAEVLKVNINSKITVYFDDIKQPLIIKQEQMKLYKTVYIEKKQNKVIVEFNNNHKDLGGSLPPNQ